MTTQMTEPQQAPDPSQLTPAQWADYDLLDPLVERFRAVDSGVNISARLNDGDRLAMQVELPSRTVLIGIDRRSDQGQFADTPHYTWGEGPQCRCPVDADADAFLTIVCQIWQQVQPELVDESPEYRLRLEHTSLAPRQARASFVESCRARSRRIAPGWIEKLEIVVSELVTNALGHSGEDDPVDMRFAFIGDRLLLEVDNVIRDEGSTPHAGSFEQSATLEEHGRGLLIVEHYVEELGTKVLSNGRRRIWVSSRIEWKVAA